HGCAGPASAVARERHVRAHAVDGGAAVPRADESLVCRFASAAAWELERSARGRDHPARSVALARLGGWPLAGLGCRRGSTGGAGNGRRLSQAGYLVLQATRPRTAGPCCLQQYRASPL